MITNEQQFRIAKARMEKFKFSITNFDMESLVNSGTDRLIAQAQLDQLQSEYEILLEQIKEYQSLSSGSSGGCQPPDRNLISEVVEILRFVFVVFLPVCGL